MEELIWMLIGLGALGVLFVVPIMILIRLSGVGRGVDELHLRLSALERALAKGAGKKQEEDALRQAQGQAPALPSERPVKRVQQAESPLLPALKTLDIPPLTPQAVEPTAFERAMAKAWNWLVIGEEFRKPGVSWEYAVATNWLLRIGIVAVLAGIAFFLKYSIEKGLMGPLGRVALSLAAGLGLIVLGVRLLFKKYHLLGQGLTGAGFVTLYFAFYAASGMYHLMPDGAAFALMACVTVAAGVMAVYLPVGADRGAGHRWRLRDTGDARRLGCERPLLLWVYAAAGVRRVGRLAGAALASAERVGHARLVRAGFRLLRGAPCVNALGSRADLPFGGSPAVCAVGDRDPHPQTAGYGRSRVGGPIP